MALIKVNNRGQSADFSTEIGATKNLIINGAMQVAQRGTSSTGLSAGGYYTVDRYRTVYNSTPDELRFTQEQSTDAPAGFANSLKLTVTTAETTLAVDERVRLMQRIEGQNLQHLKYGTSNAEYITLSFYVKSNVTGTYGVHLENRDSSRSVCASYTISASGVWEKKTISIAGDTTGSFDNDANRSLDVSWVLAAGTNYTSGTFATSWETHTGANLAPSGQTNLIDTVSNTWQITGIQLEVGDTSTTDFEHRSFAEELQLCQRYFSKSAVYSIVPDHNTDENSIVVLVDMANSLMRSEKIFFPVKMRATPTLTQLRGGIGFSSSNGQWAWYQSGSWTFYAFNTGNLNEDGFCAHGSVSGAGDGNAYWTHCAWKAEAEL